MLKEKVKILVADDNKSIRSLLERVLDGYDVITAASGDEALALAASESPALVLLDVTMPGLDGLEALRRMLELVPRPMVIMLTADRDMATASKALSLGAQAYITKPFDIDRVVKIVSVSLAGLPQKASCGGA